MCIIVIQSIYDIKKDKPNDEKLFVENYLESIFSLV